MFSFIKNLFTPPTQEIVFIEGTKFTQTPLATDNSQVVATVRQRKNGKFLLCVNENEVVGEYTRMSSLKRGAARRGLTLEA